MGNWKHSVITLDDQKADSAFQGLIGFALHF